MTQNSINNDNYGLRQLSSLGKYVSGFASVNTGDTDLYTVPTGKKALICNQNSYNSSVGNITYFWQIKVSSTYYRISSSVTLATGNRTSSTTVPAAIVLSAGESISINTATNNGLNVWIRVIEFDATFAGVKTARILSLANGDNTLYTVPAGKTAIILGTHMEMNPGTINFCNASGASRDVIIYIVPSGETAGTTNQVFPTTAVGNGVFQQFTVNASMDAGDFIVINTNSGTAGQNAYVTYMEI